MVTVIPLCLVVMAAERELAQAKNPTTQSAQSGKKNAPPDKTAADKNSTEKGTGKKGTTDKSAAEKSTGDKSANAKKTADKAVVNPVANVADEEAIKKATQQFADAFNKRNPQAVADCYHPNATLITSNGTRILGHDGIVRHYAVVIASAPEAQLKIKPTAVQFVTADVGIVEGELEFHSGPDAPLDDTRYVAVFVKSGGEWLLDRTRNFPADQDTKTSHERLEELEWLIGEWLEEDEEALARTTCRWSTDRNYLLQDFKVRMPGFPPVSGTMRIGWDPLTKQIKSWTFDSDGGYSEALWTHGKDQWILKTRGVTHLGKSFAGTSVLRRVNGNTLSWETRDRVEGGVVVPDRGPLLVRRQPPPAGD
jgi:uncharacterized protein (TIGR02246 family)